MSALFVPLTYQVPPMVSASSTRPLQTRNDFSFEALWGNYLCISIRFQVSWGWCGRRIEHTKYSNKRFESAIVNQHLIGFNQKPYGERNDEIRKSVLLPKKFLSSHVSNGSWWLKLTEKFWDPNVAAPVLLFVPVIFGRISWWPQGAALMILLLASFLLKTRFPNPHRNRRIFCTRPWARYSVVPCFFSFNKNFTVQKFIRAARVGPKNFTFVDSLK